MSIDPFEAPAADLGIEPEVTESEPIFSPKQIGVATYLGSPLAGGLLFWLNLKDHPHERMPVVLLTTGVVTLVVLLAVFGPEAPMRFVNIGIAVGFYHYAKRHADGRFEEATVHGRVRSWWRVVGLTLLAMIAYLVVVLPIMMLAEPGFYEDLGWLWRDEMGGP